MHLRYVHDRILASAPTPHLYPIMIGYQPSHLRHFWYPIMIGYQRVHLRHFLYPIMIGYQRVHLRHFWYPIMIGYQRTHARHCRYPIMIGYQVLRVPRNGFLVCHYAALIKYDPLKNTLKPPFRSTLLSH